MMTPMNDSTLSISLSAAVSLHILEIQMRGGVTQEDIDRCEAISHELGLEAQALLFHVKGISTAAVFNKVAYAIAVLSFVPGGVTLFGQHYETRPN